MTATHAPIPAELSPTIVVTAGPKGRRLHPTGLRGVLVDPRRLSIDGAPEQGVCVAGVLVSAAILIYAVRASTGVGGRPTSPEAKRIERSVSIATVIELVDSLAFPVIVMAAGRSDWVLPSIAITIGPLLLWLAHVIHIP